MHWEKRLLLWDMTVPWADFGDPALQEQALERFRAAGFSVVSLTIATDPMGIEPTIRKIAQERARFGAHDHCMLIESAGDIERARAGGKLGILFNFQGTEAFGRDVRTVELYLGLGVRHALLAYNTKNAVGDGCHERTDGGLSHYGRRLVAAMNHAGMLVDLSHTGYRTGMDAMEVSTAPVIYSHANPKHLCAHDRTITDEQIRRCAETGGVIGISGLELFLGPGSESLEARYAQHIDYCVQLVGIRHVAIGSDFIYDVPAIVRAVSRDTSGTWPMSGGYTAQVGLVAPEGVPVVLEHLKRRGYSSGDLCAIAGENWRRLLCTSWKENV